MSRIGDFRVTSYFPYISNFCLACASFIVIIFSFYFQLTTYLARRDYYDHKTWQDNIGM